MTAKTISEKSYNLTRQNRTVREGPNTSLEILMPIHRTPPLGDEQGLLIAPSAEDSSPGKNLKQYDKELDRFNKRIDRIEKCRVTYDTISNAANVSMLVMSYELLDAFECIAVDITEKEGAKVKKN